MIEYVLPLTALALSFLSFLACLRFLFSRQGFYWILPLITSVLLSIYNFYILLSPQRAITATPFSLVFFPVALSMTWYLVIIVFHYALKRTVSRNKYLNDQKKNYAEARFLEKAERRAYLLKSRKKGQKKTNGTYEPKVYNVEDSNWSAGK